MYILPQISSDKHPIFQISILPPQKISSHPLSQNIKQAPPPLLSPVTFFYCRDTRKSCFYYHFTNNPVWILEMGLTYTIWPKWELIKCPVLSTLLPIRAQPFSWNFTLPRRLFEDIRYLDYYFVSKLGGKPSAIPQIINKPLPLL